MPRIMIVDDDATIQMELEEYLSHMDHTIVGISDTGIEALETARKMKPDLILMDINMPGEMDGISAARKIKEEMDAGVIFVTGFDDPEYIERAKQVEPFGYVMKPFDEREINGVIEIALHKRKMELELARVHKQLKESEERFRTIYEQSPIGIEIYDVRGKLLHINEACRNIFGITDDSGVMGFNLFQDPNIPDKNINQLRKGEDTRFEVAFDFEKVRAHNLYETSKSEIIFLDIQITPLGLSVGDSITGYLVQVVEISEYKRAEKEREQTLSQLQATLEAAVDGIIVVSLDSRIKVISRRFKKIWHMPDAILESKNADRAFAYMLEQLKNPEVFSNKIKALFVEPRSNAFETLYLKDGRIVETYSRPQKLDDKIVGRVWAFRDVSEQKQIEEQLKQAQNMETISTLTGGIAHDYNNLLSIIMGNLSLAKEAAAPGSDLMDFLNKTEIASCKVRDLTHELMSLSEGGGPVKAMGSLKELMRIAIDTISADSGISLKKSIAQDLWPIAYDPYKMETVFRNIMTNAVEAMSNGGTLTISAKNFRFEDGNRHAPLPLKRGNYIQIFIQDNGTGIPEKHLGRIFDPYFSTKAKGVQKGMGLSLATTYSIVKKHGGHISIDSSPGTGTTVNIYLPAESRQMKSDNPTPSKNIFSSPVKRVLVMDDEEMLRTLLQQMLERLGYEAATVKDGVEAIALYKKQSDAGEPFDAVILDLTIKGGMGGEQTIQELLKIEPNILAIVSSGYCNDPIMTDFKSYGFREAIPKPYRKDDLEKALAKI